MLLMRKRGMLGPIFLNVGKKLVKSSGNYIELSGGGDVPTEAPIASGTFDPPDGIVGASYSYNTAPLFTGGAVESYSLIGTLPPGLGFSTSTGRISGTPTTIGSFTGLAVTGTNVIGSDTTNTADIAISENPPVFVGTFNPPQGTKGITYFYPTAGLFTGNVDSYSLNGTLPAGLSLNTSTGEIAGTPLNVETLTNISVTATNTGGSDTTNTASIEIVDQAPIFDGGFLPPNGTVGVAYSYDVSPLFSGGDVVSYSMNGTLPSGLSLNTSTGLISGTPDTEQTSPNLSVTATNSGGSDTTNLATIQISGVSDPPIAGTLNFPPATVGEVYSYDSSTAFTGGTPTSYAVIGTLPTGITFNTTNGLFSGTPTLEETQTLSVTASNADGSDTAGPDDLVVSAAGGDPVLVFQDLFNGAANTRIQDRTPDMDAFNGLGWPLNLNNAELNGNSACRHDGPTGLACKDFALEANYRLVVNGVQRNGASSVIFRSEDSINDFNVVDAYEVVANGTTSMRLREHNGGVATIRAETFGSTANTYQADITVNNNQMDILVTGFSVPDINLSYNSSSLNTNYFLGMRGSFSFNIASDFEVYI